MRDWSSDVCSSDLNGTPSLCGTATVYFYVLAAVNNSPVVSNTLGNVFWTEGNPPTTVKPLIGVSDPDGDNIIKAIITNLLFVAGDELSVTAPGPYSVDYNTSTGEIGRASCRERVCQYV